MSTIPLTPRRPTFLVITCLIILFCLINMYLCFLSLRYVLTELIETERLYVEDLGLIVQVCLASKLQIIYWWLLYKTKLKLIHQ